MRREKKEKLSKSAASGTVALVFLILGFQIAVFVMKVVERPEAEPRVEATPVDGAVADEAQRSEAAVPAARPARPACGPRTRLGGYAAPAAGAPAAARRPAESFPFDPNTVHLEDLQRLGLSPRQAESIENYRMKGGKFRRKEDFRKMYVVSDSLYARLEPYIEIQKLELNAADSASLTTLRGIGPYYARRIVAYRAALGGFRTPLQILEIDGIDKERFSGFSDDIFVDSTKIHKIDIWHAPADTLALHPYIRRKGADAIIRFRSVYDSSQWTLPRLSAEHVLSSADLTGLIPYLK